jgi:lipoprotein-anchoring transpeptidase ErfK/SrfK
MIELWPSTGHDGVPDGENQIVQTPGKLIAVAMGALALAAGPSAAQFFRPIERIPEPTMQDVDPGQTRGTAESVPYEFRKQPVFFRSQEASGTIIVDTSERFLYLIQSPTRAIRYGVGVGRAGFTWSGILKVTRKAEWPDWTPPEEMIARQPYLPRWMAGGPGNPMGARAMYLGGTVYRIHGTNAPDTIGQAVSSGCFRLVNDDVVDLYERVQVGAKVIVRH